MAHGATERMVLLRPHIAGWPTGSRSKT